jgi:hypothetical protein
MAKEWGIPEIRVPGKIGPYFWEGPNPHALLLYTHNRFLHRQIGDVASPPLEERSAGWAQEGYGDSDIHPKRQCSHQFQAGEIPSVQSPVMSRNMARAGRLREKVSPLMRLDFFS